MVPAAQIGGSGLDTSSYVTGVVSAVLVFLRFISVLVLVAGVFQSVES